MLSVNRLINVPTFVTPGTARLCPTSVARYVRAHKITHACAPVGRLRRDLYPNLSFFNATGLKSFSVLTKSRLEPANVWLLRAEPLGCPGRVGLEHQKGS
jgi:hypothetical protein